jgi:hypothetical protein
MRDIKNYFWIIPFIGIIVCVTAFLTPTAFFENVTWNHTIYNWIWGYFRGQIISQFDQSSTIESRFYDNPIQLISSILASAIIITCIMIITVSSYRQKDNLKKGIIKPATSLFPAIIIILTTSIWMIMMEIAELLLYNLSMWNRYFPSFGVIGMFLGAGIIIGGFFSINKTD